MVREKNPVDAGPDGVATHLPTGPAGVGGILGVGMEDAAEVVEPGPLRDRPADPLEPGGGAMGRLEMGPGHPLRRREPGLEFLVLTEGGEEQDEAEKDSEHLHPAADAGGRGGESIARRTQVSSDLPRTAEVPGHDGKGRMWLGVPARAGRTQPQWAAPRSSSGRGWSLVSGAKGRAMRPMKYTAHIVMPAYRRGSAVSS